MKEILLFIVLFEFFVFCFVKINRKKYPWLITRVDERPNFTDELLEKFFNNSFDLDLGWVKRANSSGIENGKKRQVSFNIGPDGARLSAFKGRHKIAVFGDSYAFCRQVNDDEAWPHLLSVKYGLGSKNFGVGNYGFDQALVRYEKIDLPDSVETVLIAVVPETICRIHSTWKHYLEFGNILGFKPRFEHDENGVLQIRRNVISGKSSFDDFDEILKTVQADDYFYKRKFKKFLFKFPYSFCFMKNPQRNIELFASIVLDKIAKRYWKKENASGDNLVFSVIMKYNLKQSHKMYNEHNPAALLASQMRKFVQLAESRRHRAIVVVLPQMGDLRAVKSRKNYQQFFACLGHEMEVLDLTDQFLEFQPSDLYIDDQYGGHLSVFGNSLVAHALSKKLSL